MCAAGPSAPCARDLLVSFTPACLWSRVNQALHPDCAEAAWGRGGGGRCSDAGGRRPARDHRLWSPQQQPCGQRRLPLPARCCLTLSRSPACFAARGGQLLLGEARVVGIVGLGACMRDMRVGCVAAPGLLGDRPSCVDMCCLPLGRAGSWQPLHVWGREAWGLAPGPVHGLCPQTATALPLRLGEVSWARCQCTACAARGRLLLGCTEPAPPAGDHSVPRSPAAGPQEEWPRRNSAWGLKALARGSRARVQAPRPHPLGQALLRILGLPALSTCSPGPGLCRNTLSPSPSPSPSAVAAHHLRPSCKDPTAVGQGLGASTPGPHRTSLAITRKVVPTPPGTGCQPPCVGQSPCMAGENRGGRHEPQERALQTPCSLVLEEGPSGRASWQWLVKRPPPSPRWDRWTGRLGERLLCGSGCTALPLLTAPCHPPRA